jgi:uncharacterized membrane protein YedE/YeeE
MWFESWPMLLGGLGTGLVFGFLLQKGGVSRYPVIVGQFLFTDNTVLKVMLTAIVVGAVGVYGLTSLGVLDHLAIKPALLLANLVGGLVFGVGMVGTGYCPGTCVAAAGEGSRHAWFALLGMLVGAFVFTLMYPLLDRTLFSVVDLGKVTLPELLGVSPWLVIAVLAGIAGSAFALIHRVERGAVA